MGECEQVQSREGLDNQIPGIPQRVERSWGRCTERSRQWWYVRAVTTTFFGWAPPLRLLPFFGFDVLVSMGRLESQHLLPNIARP